MTWELSETSWEGRPVPWSEKVVHALCPKCYPVFRGGGAAPHTARGLCGEVIGKGQPQPGHTTVIDCVVCVDLMTSHVCGEP